MSAVCRMMACLWVMCVAQLSTAVESASELSRFLAARPGASESIKVERFAGGDGFLISDSLSRLARNLSEALGPRARETLANCLNDLHGVNAADDAGGLWMQEWMSLQRAEFQCFDQALAADDLLFFKNTASIPDELFLFNLVAPEFLKISEGSIDQNRIRFPAVMIRTLAFVVVKSANAQLLLDRAQAQLERLQRSALDPANYATAWEESVNFLERHSRHLGGIGTCAVSLDRPAQH